jgi:ABC-type sugar transport system substrate-binding protein
MTNILQAHPGIDGVHAAGLGDSADVPAALRQRAR